MPGTGATRGRRDAVVRLVPLMASQVLVAVTGLLVTRFVAPDVRGQLTACLVWTSLAFVATSLSGPQSIVMRRESNEPPALLTPLDHRRLVLANLIAGCMVAGLMAATVALRDPLGLATVALLPAFMFAFEYASQHALVCNARSFTILRVLQAGAFLALAPAAAFTFHRTTPVLLALLLSYALTWACAPRFWWSLREVDTGNFWRWCRSTHPGLVLTHVSGRTDLLIVSLAFPPKQAGLYAAASALPGLAAFLGRGVGIAIAPQMRSSHRRRLYLEGVAVVILLSSPLVLVGTLWPAELLTALFGTDYSAGGSVLAFLAAGAWVWNLSTYQSQVMAAAGRGAAQSVAQTTAFMILLAASITAVVLDELLIAAAGNFVAYAAASAVQWWALRTLS